MHAFATEPHETGYAHRPESEPIPGYRLLQPLGKGGFGEVWKCEAPGGLLKAIKFVPGSHHCLHDSAPAEEELRAIQRIKSIRHPFLLSMERVEYTGGELAIVLELADRSLADLLLDERRAGRPGIARDALLGYLREAAEALDLMNLRHGLQHLDIKPQNLFLVSNHVKVGDFGLVAGGSTAPGCNAAAAEQERPNGNTKQGGGQRGVLGAITPLYAAPELFQGSVSGHCDQYSLAIVYQELLTGTLPFNGKNARQLLMQHLQGQPDLQSLPAGDREVVARALAKAPGDRFPSCSDFVQALLAGLTEVVTSTISTDHAQRRVPNTDRIAAAETRTTPTLKSKTRPIALRPPSPPRSDGSSDLKILDLISRTPLSEVWSAHRGESPRLVKVLFGCAGPGDENIKRLAELRHPALPAVEVLSHSPGRLVLATAPGDRSLRDVLLEAQSQGLPGVPRSRLLRLLKSAAKALTFLARQRLFHLGLNPKSLVLAGERLQLLDFGLAQLVWQPAGQALGPLNARYSAPELAQQNTQRPGARSEETAQAARRAKEEVIGPSCDVYSLALIYHEMLTGTYPDRVQPEKGRRSGFSLERLPAADRPIIAKALHPDPESRWESAVEMFEALEAASEKDTEEAPSPAQSLSTTQAAQALRTRFGSSLSAEVIRQRIEGFRQQWQGEVLSSGPGHLIFHMQTPGSLWQRWLGRQPGLEVHLHIGEPEAAVPIGVQTRTEVRMDLRPETDSPEEGAALLSRVGPLLVESVRTQLRLNQYGRLQERMMWHHPLRVSPIREDGSLGEAIDCQGKDISLGGIGFYLSGELPGANVLLHLPRTEQTPEASVAARIVRAQPCGDGWFEVGAVLRNNEEEAVPPPA
jgi:serine/threonine protein kinase